MSEKNAGFGKIPSSRNTFLQASLNVVLVFAVLLALVISVMSFQPARATGNLTITPITWNVIGLDSNLVTVGPNKFPIGARVCNTSGSDSPTVSVTFNWDDALNKYTGDPYINLRPGTLDVVSLSIPAGQCKDAYFEVEVTRDPLAYEKTRGYTITANDGVVSATTPSPRELFVEHLISQSRNSTNDVQLSTTGLGGPYTSVAPGGTMTLMVGQEYWIKLIGSTATNGYEQIETFLSLPNTIFQVLSVSTDYTADTSGNVSDPNDKLYGDSCIWVNNPLSPNYRSCVDVGKNGGDIVVDYHVKILSVPTNPLTNPEALLSLIYDFSGSSYHYNADFAGSLRYVEILDPSTLDLYKTFTPDAIIPGGTSQLTIRIPNPGYSTLTGVNFIDILPTIPGAMTIANTTTSTTGCGTPTLVAPWNSGSFSAGAASIGFSNGTIAPQTTCVIKVNVTASALGTYTNTTQNLFINGTTPGTGTDTGNTASADLTVSNNAIARTCGVTMAQWTIPTATPNPPTPSTQAANVAIATASALYPTLTAIDSAHYYSALYDWQIYGFKYGTGSQQNPQPPNYVDFVVSTKNYSEVVWSFWMDDRNPSNGPNPIVISYNNGTGWLTLQTMTPPTVGYKYYSYNLTGLTSTTGTTTFRIAGSNANNDGQNSGLDLDDITFTGCGYFPPPTLSKVFNPDPIILNGTPSLLTFTVGNNQTTPYDSQALTGVTFTDTLPTGLEIVNNGTYPATTTCTNGLVTAVNATRDITLSGASMTAGSTCTVSVYVKGTQIGTFDNVSGYIDSTESEPNKTSNGYGRDDITVIAPPVISKVFGAETIFTGNTTTLSFTITNPNHTPMTILGFSDTLPAGVDVANSSTTQCGGTLVTTDNNPNPDTVVLSGGSLAAYASCTFSLTVTGSTAGTKVNTTGTVTGTVSSTSLTGNTATATLIVEDPAPGISLKKQVGKTATGPWYDSVLIPAGATVYYKFTIENTGDVALSPVSVNDPTVSTAGCTWPGTLPVAVAGNDNHIATCIVNVITPITAVDGYTTNTARAQGTYGGTPYYSNYDSASYLNGNFGHLPSAYQNMNLFNDGGAMNVNGSTYLGTRRPGLGGDPGETDGIDQTNYVYQPTDDGVNWTGSWNTGTGTASVTATCNPGGSKTLWGWFDWNNDTDFGDPLEAQSWTVPCSPTGTTSSITIDYPGAGNLASGTFYVRFRIYDSVPTNPSALGASSITGEIEDFFMKSDGSGGTPTPVTLSYFKTELQGDDVVFNWSTATETGNLGFNLFVERDGKQVQLNDELIPSSAIDSLERQDYAFTAKTDGTVFYIEDVDVTGEVRQHGPFGLGEEYGSLDEMEPIDWQAVEADLESVDGLQPEFVSSIGQANALNLKVSQTGVYRLTYEMLRDAGLDLNGIRPTSIAITQAGRAVPIYVTSTDGWFGEGNYIEFYGRALDTLYTDTNVYTIRFSGARNPMISVDNTQLLATAKPVASYLETVLVNNQRTYTNYTPGTDPWYDNYVFVQKTASSMDFPFELNNLANVNSAASLNLVVWGMLDLPQTSDHHIRVSINGTPVADQWFDGLNEQIVKVSIPGGVLKEGTNTLTLTLPADTGGTYDLVYLDKFSVTYRRLFNAVDGKLTFTAVGNAFRVKNLPTPNVVVYRLENNRPVRVNKVTVKANGSSYMATFPGSKVKYTYFVSAVESLNIPSISKLPVPAKLDLPADYLIISHAAFIQGIQPLVQARQAQGLTVSVVNVDDLYAKYTQGVFDPKAIKDYIAYAGKNLGTRYVLLVGGDTYDYRNYLGNNSISFIPSLYSATDPMTKFVPSDPLYADYTGDNVPDLAIGRFPVRTTAELELMVNKTLAYQNKDYGQTSVFVSDKMDGFLSFKNISTAMSATLPSSWSVENIHLDNLGVSAAQTQLVAAMNRGVSLVNFTGHSGPTKWTFSGLFSTKNAGALTNAGRPFVVVQWGCWNTYYVDPVNNYLVQSFLFSGDRGAAAVLGASTLTDSYSEELLGKLLMPRLVTPGMTMGQALLDAKQELALAHPDLLDVLIGWTLMGDPALVVAP